MNAESYDGGDRGLDLEMFRHLPPEVAENIGEVWLTQTARGWLDKKGRPVKNPNGWLYNGAKLMARSERRSRERETSTLEALAQELLARESAAGVCECDDREHEASDQTVRDVLLEVVRECYRKVFDVENAFDEVHLQYTLTGNLTGSEAAGLVGLKVGSFYTRQVRKLEALRHAVLREALFKCNEAGMPESLSKLVREFVNRYLNY